MYQFLSPRERVSRQLRALRSARARACTNLAANEKVVDVLEATGKATDPRCNRARNQRAESISNIRLLDREIASLIGARRATQG